MAQSNDFILKAAQTIAPSTTAISHHGDYTIVVPLDAVVDVLTEFKEHPELQFNSLVDITVIDWKRKGERFDVVYFLYSIPTKARIRVKAPVREDKPHVPTMVDVWEAANWYEREAYDMYGIIFDGHPDLRRFYMPEDFMDANGEPLWPLRKDFPLAGIPGSLPLPLKPESERPEFRN